jgi:hypothetical protein
MNLECVKKPHEQELRKRVMAKATLCPLNKLSLLLPQDLYKFPYCSKYLHGSCFLVIHVHLDSLCLVVYSIVLFYFPHITLHNLTLSYLFIHLKSVSPPNKAGFMGSNRFILFVLWCISSTFYKSSRYIVDWGVLGYF